MPVEILMPEIGEGVHEGTVSRWLKKEGDSVKEDEPIVEIMTDKVNTELPAPATGVLSKILIAEGDTVEVFHAMGLIESGSPAAQTNGTPFTAGTSTAESDSAPAEPSKGAAPEPTTNYEQPTTNEGRKWFTPLVRSIARENKISDAELSSVVGSGPGGRVTKKDLEAYLAGGRGPAVSAPTAKPKAPEAKPTQPVVAGPDQEITRLVGMRKMIADAMVRSSAVPVVSTVTQVDVTTMVKFREANKESFLETYGVKLTYTPFFIKALAETLREFPVVNSSLQGEDQLVSNKGVHVGIAVSLGAKGDEGLIVPVIRNCESKNLIDIARALDDIAKKARANKLGVADVQGGTFTLTNPGTYGALFGTPMINAPQGGILGAYAITKQPVIVDDMIAIRSIMHLVLTYDHRIIDGLVAGKFLAGVRDKLQGFDFFK